MIASPPLGSRVRDKVSGFTGVVLGVHHWLKGATKVTIGAHEGSQFDRTIDLDQVAPLPCATETAGCAAAGKDDPNPAPEKVGNPYMWVEPVVMAIVSEREYQEKRWPGHRHSTAEWLLIMQKCLDDAKRAYVNGHGDDQVLHELRQVAAVGVAAMEQCGAPLRGEEPL